MKNFHLQIVTPDGIAFDGNASSLLVRTDDGDVQILADHVDYMASIGTGRAKFVCDEGEKIASCSGGFLTVSKKRESKESTKESYDGVKTEVKLVTVTFEFKENIDISRAKKAKEKAERLISEAKSEREEEVARAKLMRALNRLDVSNFK